MFGKQIVELRKKRGLTQAELANSIGISRSALSLYEIEKREPDINILNKLASLFEVPVDYILGNKQEKMNCINYKIDTPEFSLNFKKRVLDLMAEQKMSEDDFTKKTGFYTEDTNSYLHSNNMPSIKDLIKIAEVLNVSIDYLLNVSKIKRISAEEETLLQTYNRCDDDCKKYLLAKAGVLSVEGISAVAIGEYGKYIDDEKKSFLSNGIVRKEA